MIDNDRVDIAANVLQVAANFGLGLFLSFLKLSQLDPPVWRLAILNCRYLDFLKVLGLEV